MARSAGVLPALAKEAGETPADQDDLDALVSRVDPDRWLSSRFVADADRRADLVALYAFDHELARASKVTSNPLIAQIRLTWWREALDEVYGGKAVRGHPAARALALAVGRRSLPREPFDAIIDSRISVFGRTELGADEMSIWADDVGGSTALLASLVLDPESSPEAAGIVGRAWGFWMLRGVVVNDLGLGETALHAARSSVRSVTARAFPAIAHVTLAKGDLNAQFDSPLISRLRLLTAVLRGRL